MGTTVQLSSKHRNPRITDGSSQRVLFVKDSSVLVPMLPGFLNTPGERFCVTASALRLGHNHWPQIITLEDYRTPGGGRGMQLFYRPRADEEALGGCEYARGPVSVMVFDDSGDDDATT